MRRERLLHFFSEDRRGAVVAHSSPHWTRPTPVAIAGLRLLETRANGQGDGWAQVELGQRLARHAGCEPGRYRLGLGDAIGSARILAILRHGLLLERHHALRYLARTLSAAPVPRWLLAWGSRYEVHLAHGGRAAPKRRAAKPAPRRRKR